jgi:hypothetical protein
MEPVSQLEIDISQVNQNYFCTDQTNVTQKVTTRNFYDTDQIELFIPGTDLVIGKQLYASSNCQTNSDFSICLQNISNMLSVDYDNIVGTIVFNYSVVNTENLTNSCKSNVQSVYGVFTDIKSVLIQPVPNSTRILYSFYKD